LGIWWGAKNFGGGDKHSKIYNERESRKKNGLVIRDWKAHAEKRLEGGGAWGGKEYSARERAEPSFSNCKEVKVGLNADAYYRPKGQ